LQYRAGGILRASLKFIRRRCFRRTVAATKLGATSYRWSGCLDRLAAAASLCFARSIL